MDDDRTEVEIAFKEIRADRAQVLRGLLLNRDAGSKAGVDKHVVVLRNERRRCPHCLDVRRVRHQEVDERFVSVFYPRVGTFDIQTVGRCGRRSAIRHPVIENDFPLVRPVEEVEKDFLMVSQDEPAGRSFPQFSDHEVHRLLALGSAVNDIPTPGSLGGKTDRSTMRNILLVQSNPYLGEILKASFQREGFSAMLLGSVSEIPRSAAETVTDLVVLDETSAMGGIDIFTDIRLATSAPILVLARAEAERQWAGIADDVLAAPFAVQELFARSSTLVGRGALRRTIYAAGDISMNLEMHRVTRGARVIHLGPTEFRLLQLFLAEPQRLWSRAEIVDKVWSPGRDERNVDVAVKKLRAALNRKGESDAIRTVRGAGYGMA